MPSSLNHEGVIALVRDRPAFAASLLRELLNVEVPHFTEARLTEATLHQLVPVEYYADAVVLFVDLIDTTTKPVLGTSSKSSSSPTRASRSPGRFMPPRPGLATSVRSS